MLHICNIGHERVNLTISSSRHCLLIQAIFQCPLAKTWLTLDEHLVFIGCYTIVLLVTFLQKSLKALANLYYIIMKASNYTSETIFLSFVSSISGIFFNMCFTATLNFYPSILLELWKSDATTYIIFQFNLKLNPNLYYILMIASNCTRETIFLLL